MSLAQLNAAADLRQLPYQKVVEGLTFSALLSASAAERHDVPIWRSLSNLLQEEWPDHGLSARTAWWAPRRSDARALGGRRSLSVGSTSAGGDLAISSAVSAIAAATRPRLILEQAGASRQEIASVVDAVVPEWTANSGAAAWVGEGVTVPEAALSVTTGAATPRTAGAYLEVSRRLLKNAAGLEQSVAAELQRLVRNHVEAGLIAGTGTESQPLGLLNTPGASTVTIAGALPTAAELSDMLDAYLGHDGDPAACVWFVNPSDFASLLVTELAASTGVFAAQIAGTSRAILGAPAYLSRHIPEGKLVLCDPRNLSIYFWRAPQIITNPYALDTSGGLRLTVLNDVNLVVQHRAQLVIGG